MNEARDHGVNGGGIMLHRKRLLLGAVLGR